MGSFYKGVPEPGPQKNFYQRFYCFGKNLLSAWYQRQARILKRAGLGGKKHLFEKGHVQWNRKGRW